MTQNLKPEVAHRVVTETPMEPVTDTCRLGLRLAMLKARLDQDSQTSIDTIESDELAEPLFEAAATLQTIRSASPFSQDTQAQDEDKARDDKGTPRPQIPGSPAPLRPIPDEQMNEKEKEIGNINLDDPDEHDWEAESFDFGAEPEDESWDMWGCEHRYHELRKETIDSSWIRDTERYS